MATKTARRARRERQRLAALAHTEAALAIVCPVLDCNATQGVWCGMNGSFWTGGTPWMHERRYQAVA